MCVCVYVDTRNTLVLHAALLYPVLKPLIGQNQTVFYRRADGFLFKNTNLAESKYLLYIRERKKNIFNEKQTIQARVFLGRLINHLL